jgi:hypothetical protein
VSGQVHSPGKEPLIATGQEAGWAPEPGLDDVERRKILPYQDSNTDPLTVQPVANPYADYTIQVYLGSIAEEYCSPT